MLSSGAGEHGAGALLSRGAAGGDSSSPVVWSCQGSVTGGGGVVGGGEGWEKVGVWRG